MSFILDHGALHWHPISPGPSSVPPLDWSQLTPRLASLGAWEFWHLRCTLVLAPHLACPAPNKLLSLFKLHPWSLCQCCPGFHWRCQENPSRLCQSKISTCWNLARYSWRRKRQQETTMQSRSSRNKTWLPRNRSWTSSQSARSSWTRLTRTLFSILHFLL